MKTDSFFHRFFRDFPEAFFALIGESQKQAKQYKFTSVEVKEFAFYCEASLQLKPKPDHFYFSAVQFRPKAAHSQRMKFKCSVKNSPRRKIDFTCDLHARRNETRLRFYCH